MKRIFLSRSRRGRTRDGAGEGWQGQGEGGEDAARVHLRREVRLGRFLQDLVEGALEVMERVPPGERRGKLEARFRQIIGVDMEVAPDCGLSLTCKEATTMPVWSPEAQERLEEDRR